MNNMNVMKAQPLKYEQMTVPCYTTEVGKRKHFRHKWWERKGRKKNRKKGKKGHIKIKIQKKHIAFREKDDRLIWK